MNITNDAPELWIIDGPKLGRGAPLVFRDEELAYRCAEDMTLGEWEFALWKYVPTGGQLAGWDGCGQI